MRKPAFCICKKKAQISNHAANQRLSFKLEISKLKPSSVIKPSSARVVPDLVGNPKDMFSSDEAQM